MSEPKKIRYYFNNLQLEDLKHTLELAKEMWGKMIHLEDIAKEDIGRLVMSIIVNIEPIIQWRWTE